MLLKRPLRRLKERRRCADHSPPAVRLSDPSTRSVALVVSEDTHPCAERVNSTSLQTFLCSGPYVTPRHYEVFGMNSASVVLRRMSGRACHTRHSQKSTAAASESTV